MIVASSRAASTWVTSASVLLASASGVSATGTGSGVVVGVVFVYDLERGIVSLLGGEPDVSIGCASSGDQ